MSGQHWECPCGWAGHEDELVSHVEFIGNREEPPEYGATCPQCHGDWEQMSEPDPDVECPACSEIALPAKGGECTECHGLAYF
jgi:hypothetical protein